MVDTLTTPCLTAPVGVTISTGVHPGGLNIWWGAPRCQEERKSDWGAGKKPIVLLGCCCTAVLLYCCTAVLLYCWGTGVTFQNFSGVALTFLKILWGCRILIENALGFRKSVKISVGPPQGHPGAPRPGQWDRV